MTSPPMQPQGTEAGNIPPASLAVLPLAASPSELVVVYEVHDDISSDEQEEAAAGPVIQQMPEHSAKKFTIPWTVVHRKTSMECDE